MAELEIAKPNFFQQLQAFDCAASRTGLGECGEEGDGFFHRGLEQIGDGKRA